MSKYTRGPDGDQMAPPGPPPERLARRRYWAKATAAEFQKFEENITRKHLKREYVVGELIRAWNETDGRT